MGRSWALVGASIVWSLAGCAGAPAVEPPVSAGIPFPTPRVQALLKDADATKAEADALPFPRYRGDGSRDDVHAHVVDAIEPWVTAKRTRIEAAQARYQDVVGDSAAPPMARALAAARIAEMWSGFVKDFRSAPVPSEWNREGVAYDGVVTWREIREAYAKAIDEASEQDLGRAHRAYLMCASLAGSETPDLSRWCAEHARSVVR